MITYIVAAVIIFMILWVRFAPVGGDEWHVDPETVEKGIRPNQYLMRDGQDADSRVFDMSVQELAQKFDDVALSKPDVTRLAGSVADGWVTYVQRTKVMRYPDYISVKVTDAGGGKSRLSIYSRSRYGRSDLGVNKARITNWLAAVSG